MLRAWKAKFEQAEKRKLEDIKELQVCFFFLSLSPSLYIANNRGKMTSAILAEDLEYFQDLLSSMLFLLTE